VFRTECDPAGTPCDDGDACTVDSCSLNVLAGTYSCDFTHTIDFTSSVTDYHLCKWNQAAVALSRVNLEEEALGVRRMVRRTRRRLDGLFRLNPYIGDTRRRVYRRSVWLAAAVGRARDSAVIDLDTYNCLSGLLPALEFRGPCSVECG
jgi:hypothetical protein